MTSRSSCGTLWEEPGTSWRGFGPCGCGCATTSVSTAAADRRSPVEEAGLLAETGLVWFQSTTWAATWATRRS